MNPHYLPATARDDVPAWAQTVVAFLAEKERRSGSRRTVEGYARMLWPFLEQVGSPDRVTPAHAPAWAHGIGASGREPSSATVGARIACLSSYFRFLIRMNIATSNPCDALERPKTVQSVARGLSADEVRRLLAVVPDTVAGRRDRALLLVFVLTGRRRAEVIGLTAGDISVEGETVFYSYKGKGGKRGRQELPRPAYEALCVTLVDAGLSLVELELGASLWQAASGPRGVTSATFYARFRRYLRAAGLAPSGLHLLRHTAAKLRRDAGASIEAVSSFLDHSSLAVTSVYLRRLEGEADRTWPDVGRQSKGVSDGQDQEGHRGVKRLPRSLDEIGGLRAARWIRESTAGQYDRYGPASQREQQDRFIERHGLVDTGLVYQVAHSGRTVWRSTTMATMVEDLRLGRFDLLLTGYSDRWQRNLRRTLELLEDELHPNGVALVMCDRKILSSDPSDWDELISEAAGAEKYSRRLSERITEGYAAKFDQEHDPGGHAALGFRRLPDRRTLEIDPDRMPVVVGLFERYALGNVSATQLEAETGLAATRIRMILMNPLYNGWIRRHRGKDETRRPAPWRFDPPVSDDLWSRVEDVRRARTQGGGPRHRGRLDLLAGLLECTCGRRIRSDGRMGNSERVAKLHTDPCAGWGPKARIAASTWEVPVLAQLGSLRVDNAMRAQITAVLSAGERPATMDRARLERQMRELALEHAAARLDDAEYLARMARLRGELEIVGARPARDLPARRATEWLDALAETWQQTELVEEKSDVIHAVYERIVIEGPRFVGLRLTPAAYRHGLALALPEAVMARPTGVGHALTAYRMPIEGRDEWVAAVERLA